jgi:DNA-binding NarL/FixJ family response regulator
VVLIEGEAGIGKSRLLAEYTATASGARMLVADCPPFRQPQTLGPVVDAVRKATDTLAGLRLSPLAGMLRPVFPEWASELPEAPEPAEDASAARHRLFRALAELLTGLDVSALAIEDVHWADEATLEFLLFLAFRRPQPLSLVLTYRPDDVPAGSLLPRLTSRLPAGATRLRLSLGLLDAAATAELVSSMLAGEQVSAQFSGFIHEHTEGVPLAIEETIRLMADRADLTRREHGWVHRQVTDIAVPATIRDAVLERAGRLDGVTRAVLDAAATLGDPADEALLAAVTGLAPKQLRAGLSAALGTGLVRADDRGRVSFRHALGAQAAYEAIPAPLRRTLHLRAASSLEGLTPVPVARLARHYREAGDTDRWCEYAALAADLAVSSSDEASAADLARDLITGAGVAGCGPAARILDKLTFGSLTEPVLAEMTRVLRAALSADAMARAESAVLRFHLGRMLMLLDEYEQARVEMERAIPDLADDPARVARAMSLLGWAIGTTAPAAEHLRWLRQAAGLADALDPIIRLRLQVERSAALLVLGEEEGWAVADSIPARAATAEERTLITLSRANNGELAMMWGRYAAAQAWLVSARELAQAHHYVRYRGNVEITQVHLDWFTGRWDRLADRIRALEEGILAQPMAHQEAALVTGMLDAATGERAWAEEKLTLVLAERLRRGAGAYTMEPAGALARLYLDEGRAADALAVTATPAAILPVKQLWVYAAEMVPARVAALVAMGRAGEAAEQVETMARGLGRIDAPAAKAALTLCRGLLAEASGDQVKAAQLFGRAAAAWQALPRPYDALLARERQARCLLAAGTAGAGLAAGAAGADGAGLAAGAAEEGRALLTEVLAGLSELGATAVAARVARALRENGVPARRPGAGRPGYGDQLSPRELEVVRLVAEGRTNQQIAESLFLSPKTVATHVYAAMRKLNVPSRTALAVAAVTSGIATPTPRSDTPTPTPT